MASREKQPLLAVPAKELDGNGLQQESVVKKSKTIPFEIGFGYTIHLSSVAVNLSLTLLTAFTQVGMGVALPLYTNSLVKHKLCGQNYLVGDTYFALLYTAFWFVVFFGALIAIGKALNPATFQLKSPVSFFNRIIIGVLNAFNGIFVVYASLPDRTPAFLQPLLSTSIIPFTVIARYIIMRKTVSVPRLICCLAVLVGLIITAEPVIFNIDGGNEGGSTEKSSSLKKGVWSAVFAFGFLPAAIANVVEELAVKPQEKKVTKPSEEDGEPSRKGKEDVNTLVFMLWIQFWNFITLGVCFFVDFIPEFGFYSNINDFGSQMGDGMRCMLGHGPPVSNVNCTMEMMNSSIADHTYDPDPHCSVPIARCWLFILFYCLANLFSLMLIKYADGAIYLVIVNALVNPLSGIFWSLFAFHSETSKFLWNPTWNTATIYVLAGLLIMVPGVVLYNYLGKTEGKKTEWENEDDHGKGKLN